MARSDSPGTAAPNRMAAGYLAEPALSADAGLSPSPPVAGSAADARDTEGMQAALALRGTPRWAQATADAELFGPHATSGFSCAAGVEIGPQTTPKTDALMRKSMADLGLSTSAIKRRYQRPRPFMVNGQPTCTPDWEPLLRRDGSYPSGHSAIGFGWGLILAEVIPDRAAALVARGRAFGDSRRICNVHWLSDVEEGRIAAAANVARLNADPVFRKDMDRARKELKKVRAEPRDCASEAGAASATDR
ncbi:phosphatase PAP2 family protein [Sphingomonas solaris]|uniref:Acid phosphatase n=2 Tax=Alterirhizorhabdus solaris TaxID=2529389 RepID=A0A558RD41_9SPHN|nr:phosphatase PAP2 family protein [Sphingomonas solaris]